VIHVVQLPTLSRHFCPMMVLFCGFKFSEDMEVIVQFSEILIHIAHGLQCVTPLQCRKTEVGDTLYTMDGFFAVVLHHC